MTYAEWLSYIREGSLIVLGALAFFGKMALIGWIIAFLDDRISGRKRR